MRITKKPIEHEAILSARERLSFAERQRAPGDCFSRVAFVGLERFVNELVRALSKQAREREIAVFVRGAAKLCGDVRALGIAERREERGEHLAGTRIRLLGQRADFF